MSTIKRVEVWWSNVRYTEEEGMFFTFGLYDNNGDMVDKFAAKYFPKSPISALCGHHSWSIMMNRTKKHLLEMYNKLDDRDQFLTYCEWLFSSEKKLQYLGPENWNTSFWDLGIAEPIVSSD